MPRADGYLTNKEMSDVMRKIADGPKMDPLRFSMLGTAAAMFPRDVRVAPSSGEKSTARPLLVKRQK